MFNQSTSGYTLSDIASVTGRNNGNGAFGDDGWWIILLFLFGFGGNGLWGGNGSRGSTREEIAYGFDMNGLENGIRGIQQGLCDGFYATRQGISDLGYAMKDCCCTINRNIDGVKYDLSTAIHAEGEATRALINQNTIQELRDKLEARDREVMVRDFQLSQLAQNQYLVNELRPCAKPAYITCSPYTTSSFCGV
jgi:hypothetical protein